MVREIFREERKETLEQRPLGPISHFVIEELPSRLETIRLNSSFQELSKLNHRVDLLFENFDYGFLIKSGKLDQGTLNLSRLDVLMIDSAVAHSSRILRKNGYINIDLLPGKRFLEISDRIIALSGRPGHITYEDIVLNNPEMDKRVFTTGPIGKHEEDFYEGHRLIEVELEKGIPTLKKALESAKISSDPALVKTGLLEINKSLRFLIEYTGRIGRDMRVSDFTVFREYLQTHPIKNLSGPSGQFTARVPLIEILLVGDRIGPGHEEYFRKFRQYFPVEGMTDIDKYFSEVKSNGSLLSYIESWRSPKELKDLMLQNLKLILQFRNAHFVATKKQLFDTTKGPVVGTSGVTDSEAFLKKRIEAFTELIETSFSEYDARNT